MSIYLWQPGSELHFPEKRRQQNTPVVEVLFVDAVKHNGLFMKILITALITVFDL